MRRLSDEELEEKLQNPEIIRNRLKVFSVQEKCQGIYRYTKGIRQF